MNLPYANHERRSATFDPDYLYHFVLAADIYLALIRYYKNTDRTPRQAVKLSDPVVLT